MAIVAPGSVALDDIVTEAGSVYGVPGGSALYFAIAASLFCPVRLVSIIGDDFPCDELDFLARRGIDLAGLQRVSGEKTFRWGASYDADLHGRTPFRRELNVTERFVPTLDAADIHYAIVGNIVLLRIRPYQEKDYRHLVFNAKVRQVVRIDSIADACVLLPEDHGLIFPKGYYLQTGQQKLFNNAMEGMVFEKRLASPNGEDHLFVFYNRDAGLYVLLSYNVIAQEVATPIVCSGYAFFADGTLVYFRAGAEAQRHHALQVWRTPYCAADCGGPVQNDSYLFKIGNKDIVRCMAECSELLTLAAKEDSYANLYVDVAREAQDILDA